jgi:hypothetical protein
VRSLRGHRREEPASGVATAEPPRSQLSLFERIKGLGVAVEQEPYQPDGVDGDFWLATFKDPDGNFFQIASPMPTQYRPSVGA